MVKFKQGSLLRVRDHLIEIGGQNRTGYVALVSGCMFDVKVADDKKLKNQRPEQWSFDTSVFTPLFWERASTALLAIRDNPNNLNDDIEVILLSQFKLKGPGIVREVLRVLQITELVARRKRARDQYRFVLTSAGFEAVKHIKALQAGKTVTALSEFPWPSAAPAAGNATAAVEDQQD